MDRPAYLDDAAEFIVRTKLSDLSAPALERGRWIVADTARRMWRSSSVCDANPNDPCCYICATDPPDGRSRITRCAARSRPRSRRSTSRASSG